MNNKDSQLTKPLGLQDLGTFSNDIIKLISVIITTVKCNDWQAKVVEITVIEDGRRPIISRDLFPLLGLSVIQARQIQNVDSNRCPVS